MKKKKPGPNDWPKKSPTPDPQRPELKLTLMVGNFFILRLVMAPSSHHRKPQPRPRFWTNDKLKKKNLKKTCI